MAVFRDSLAAMLQSALDKSMELDSYCNFRMEFPPCVNVLILIYAARGLYSKTWWSYMSLVLTNHHCSWKSIWRDSGQKCSRMRSCLKVLFVIRFGPVRRLPSSLLDQMKCSITLNKIKYCVSTQLYSLSLNILTRKHRILYLKHAIQCPDNGKTLFMQGVNAHRMHSDRNNSTQPVEKSANSASAC